MLESSIMADPSELELLIKAVDEGALPCTAVRRGEDGDCRYWGVSTSGHPLLQRFEELARQRAVGAGLPSDCTILLMVNEIAADRSPNGSGGGWHVDSVRRQFKLFCYLTDCRDRSNGPLTLLRHPVRSLESLVIVANRVFGGGSRFSRTMVRTLKFLGFREVPVLADAGRPFWVPTNRIHRGAPIVCGRRVMVTAYIYERDLPNGLKQHLGLAA